MFRTLGLFKSTPCPDDTCHRPYCYFGHSNGPSNSGTSTPTRQAIKKSEVRIPAAEGPAAKKRKVEGQLRNAVHHESGNGIVGAGNESIARRKAEDGKMPPAAGTSNKSNQSNKLGSALPAVTNRSTDVPAASTATARSVPQASNPAFQHGNGPSGSKSSASRPVAITGSTGAPVLSRDPQDLKSSRQPYADRQKALTTLYTQFSKVYAPITSTHPTLASTSAIEQEAEISRESENLAAYKRTVHSTAVSILRREPATSIRHPSVGTLRESRIKVDKAAKAALSRLSHASCSRYCLPLSEFADWGFPEPDNKALAQPEEHEPDAERQEKSCDRCQKNFVVSADDIEERARKGECVYHFGRLRPEKVEGKRMWLFTCCGKERGGAGCQDGVHVFSEKDDDVLLARRQRYVTVEEQCEVNNKKGGAVQGWLEVVAIDCEMVSTTAGTSLGRATIVDDKGEIVLDEMVRQHAKVIDTNTRFSGLSEEDLETAVMDLTAVRAAACMFIGPDTIIVGHGLENDLRAMRLLHDKIIDTAILFPHDKGKPFRRALRDLVKEKLGYFIQDRISDKGHSSAEDAQATLEMLKYKVRDDAT